MTLFGMENAQILSRANNLLHTNKRSDTIRAYNDFKNLYLRSIMNNDKELKVNALLGIIKSGKKLHIDTSRYAYEYHQALRKLRKEQSKRTKKHSNNIEIASISYLKLAYINENEIVLDFNNHIKKAQIRHFTIFDDKKHSYKYVFDISHAVLNRSYKLKSPDIKRIRLAQYKQNTIRLVVETNKKIKLKYRRENDSLVVVTPLQKEENKNIEIISKYTIAPKRLDRNKTIVIDPGHGGKDPGAIGYRNYHEKDVVLQIGLKLKNILKSRGYKVYMTRQGDYFIKLSKRTQYANRRSADIFISIHANAVSKKQANDVYGIETYFLAKSRTQRAKNVAEKENSADLSDMDFYGKKSFLDTLSSHNIVASNKLAIDLQRGVLGVLTQKYKDVSDGGVREGPFWVLVGAQMPSVLVEVGFITNPKEASRLVNPRYQKSLATGLANGIERYFLNN
ncbi:N-acetylmuramoyl-L-alanine amidase [hydrothermal vent metagenome]|uniref:N-acetylmuramoyl-L-alanine amidase n=1 Tax=hydrothermal vent metagenome TaxID=652676 RepID=A0A1W1D2Z4_9ZZZZ